MGLEDVISAAFPATLYDNAPETQSVDCRVRNGDKGELFENLRQILRTRDHSYMDGRDPEFRNENAHIFKSESIKSTYCFVTISFVYLVLIISSPKIPILRNSSRVIL